MTVTPNKNLEYGILNSIKFDDCSLSETSESWAEILFLI